MQGLLCGAGKSNDAGQTVDEEVFAKKLANDPHEQRMGVEGRVEKRPAERYRQHHPVRADRQILAMLVPLSSQDPELKLEFAAQIVDQCRRENPIDLEPTLIEKALGERHNALFMEDAVLVEQNSG